MSTLIGNFQNVISIGYVCDTKAFITNTQQSFVRGDYVFDRMGSPMWAVSELVANNFQNFLTNIGSKVLFDNSEKSYVLDTTYYLRLMLSSPQSINRNKLIASTTIAKNRFMAAINGNQSILFIRSEEPTSYSDIGSRISLPEYADKYANTELSYVNVFSDTVKNINPNLQFKILYLGRTLTAPFNDETHNVVGIPIGDAIDYRDPFAGKKIVNAVSAQSTFLQTHLVLTPAQPVQSINQPAQLQPITGDVGTQILQETHGDEVANQVTV